MSKKNNGFVFYRNYWEAALKLPKRDREKFITAVIEKGLDDKEPQLDGVADGMYSLVKCSIEANARRRRAGRKAADKSDDDGDADDEINSDINDEINFTENAELISSKKRTNKESKIKNKELKINNEESITPPLNPPEGENAAGGFARFWDAYPRKIGRGDAMAKWVELFTTSDPSVDLIIRAIWDAKVNDSRFREDRYTPTPANWLADKPWENPLLQKTSYDADDLYQAALKRAYAEIESCEDLT